MNRKDKVKEDWTVYPNDQDKEEREDLSAMEWTAFQAHVVHHAERDKKKKQIEEVVHKQLIKQLKDAQLN